MEKGIINVRRTLRTEGIEPDVQKRLDLACPHPHIHPRSRRNDLPVLKVPRIRRKKRDEA